MTNSVESITNVVSLTTQTHITAQAVAYSFKEWAGVFSLIFTSLYACVHAVFVVVVHYGGLHKMWTDFIGKPISTVNQTAVGDQKNMAASETVSPVSPVQPTQKV